MTGDLEMPSGRDAPSDERQKPAAHHTPGPWSIEDPLGPNILSVIARGDRPPYEWTHIAQLAVEMPEDSFDPGIIEQEANARLIATAPEMLEALKIAYTFLTQPQKLTRTEATYRMPDYNGLVGKLRAAIRKAESEARSKSCGGAP